MNSRSRYLRDGIIAGLIGAAIVAVWFLIYDAARGHPFRTPALLGAATLQGLRDPGAVTVTPELVAQYTVLHGVVFAMIGVLIAYLIVSAQSQPSRLLTVVIALLCFEVALLAVLTWWAHPVVTALQWWAILIGRRRRHARLLLRRASRARPRPAGPDAHRARRARRGLPAPPRWPSGSCSTTAPPARLRTPASRPRSPRLRDPAALVITPALVLEYTLFHGLAFVLFGWATAGTLALADREPQLLFGFIMLFCCFEVFAVAMIVTLAYWLLEAVAWWTILAGNLLAAGVMLAYFLREHRVAWREFLHAHQ
jgi:hypothetical protein